MEKLIHKSSGELETEDIYKRLGQRFKRRSSDRMFEVTSKALDRQIREGIRDPNTFGPNSRYVWLTILNGSNAGSICYRDKDVLIPIDD